ncbi:ATP-binding protein [Streptomyces sp. NPDC049949]|uniref:ATP-binding protein n=1 Tax=Streptomyces sp. NPDC049949 TaxID=3154627 RepID=UPI003415F9F0
MSISALSAQHSPRVSYRFVVPRTATAPKIVRDLVAVLVAVFGHEDIVGHLKVCVSEVVTNAYQYTRTAQITVDVSLGTDNVTVWVDDGRPGWLPRVPSSAPPWHDESGRGLYLVARIADELGVGASDDGAPRLGFSIGYEGAA